MLLCARDVLTEFPVRKSKQEKQAFRNAVQSYGEKLGYAVTVEKGRFGACNVLLGNPDSADFLITAHYDTCAYMPMPNFITPCNVGLYLAYQMLLVLIMSIAAMAVGVAAGLVLGKIWVKWTILAVYWLLLALLIFGPANRSNVNDNTSGVVTLLEIAKTMPENQRHKVCFVLFDLEEAGLIGSASYRRKHKQATDHQLILNLDCVGDGDHILMLPTGKLRKDRKKLASLYKACGYFGTKSLLVYEKKGSIYPSDQKNFPWGVAICALRKKRKTLYLSRIHTRRDTVMDETNVNILRAALTTFVCCSEVNEERKMKK